MQFKIKKFPRTPHLTGSHFQVGDHDLAAIPFDLLEGRHLILEEKVDGANAGLRFDQDGTLFLQSRGHFLTGGNREKHFQMFKTWANCHAHRFFEVLTDRYIMYGEWMYAKHTVYYDKLPHYFLEFDLFDTQNDCFLSTERRQQLLQDLPIASVPVLAEGVFETPEQIVEQLKPSLYKSADWQERLKQQLFEQGLDPEKGMKETDSANTAEGLYMKIEEGGQVIERFKFVRSSFQNAIMDSGTHWLNRPIVPNQLAEDVDIFSYSL